MITTIFCNRTVSDGRTETEEVVFDSVTGLGINKSKPFLFSYQGLFGQAAQAAAMPLAPLIPILPKLPATTIKTTIWLSYPDNQPTPRETPYRCHAYIQGIGQVVTWLPVNAELWAAMGVTEFTESFQDNLQRIPNPDYAPAKAIYDQKYQEWTDLFKANFVLNQNWTQPDWPTGTGWHYFQNGIEIENFNQQDYYCEPTPITDTTHPQYNRIIKAYCLVEPVQRLKYILNA